MRLPGLACVLVLSVSVLGAAPASAAPVPVTTCGQVVHGFGQLTGDLDCTGQSDPGVRLGHGSKLDLAGFTLAGGDGDGVACDGRCAITSKEDGGTIAGFAGHGVVSRPAVDSNVGVRVNRTIVRDNGGNGVWIDELRGSMTITKSAILGNGGMGVFSPDRLRVGRSTISGNQLEGANGDTVLTLYSLFELNGTGITAATFARVAKSDVIDNVGDGIQIGASLRTNRLNVLRNGGNGILFTGISADAQVFFAEVSDNGLDGVRVAGPQTQRLRVKYAFVRGNGGSGVVSRDVRVNVSRLDDNGLYGVVAEPGDGDCRVGVDRFSVLGNGTDPSCGVSTTCADVASCDPPLHVTPKTDCATSYDTSSGFPGSSWGVCDDE